jgi:hypothetical protein
MFADIIWLLIILISCVGWYNCRDSVFDGKNLLRPDQIANARDPDSGKNLLQPDQMANARDWRSSPGGSVFGGQNPLAVYGGRRTQSAPRVEHVRVFIKPSTADPAFIQRVTAIIKKTEFKSAHVTYEMEIINRADNATVTLEIGNRDTMHADNEAEYDDHGERIYFSYTYDRRPRQIIFDPGNWCDGVPRSGLTLDLYRDYVVRHEVMHALGYAHQPCDETTAINGVCPVMYQSTRGPPPGYQCGHEIMPVDYTKRLPW